MIDKEFKIITLNNGKKVLTIVFPDKKYALLSTFFFVEIGSFGDWIRNNIQEIVQGKAEKRNISGNVCELDIKKRDTTIYDMLAEDGRGVWCSVPTQELLSMIDEWHERRATLDDISDYGIL